MLSRRNGEVDTTPAILSEHCCPPRLATSHRASVGVREPRRSGGTELHDGHETGGPRFSTPIQKGLPPERRETRAPTVVSQLDVVAEKSRKPARRCRGGIARGRSPLSRRNRERQLGVGVAGSRKAARRWGGGIARSTSPLQRKRLARRGMRSHSRMLAQQLPANTVDGAMRLEALGAEGIAVEDAAAAE